MTIHPETEIVASSHDAKTKAHTYTIERGGKRWTITIPDADFERFGPVMGASAAVNKMNRRKHLATRLAAAMEGPADVR
jgi:hypothetical protein